jgi:hypothetical protein
LREVQSMLRMGCGLIGAAMLLAAPVAAAAAVDDSVVQEVRVAGNRLVPTVRILSVIGLHGGAALPRAAVRADVASIESLYKRRRLNVAVTTDLTHPGEREGQPRTTLTFNVAENATRPPAFTADPLEVYYDNTAVCAAAQTGNDLCHLWLNRDGSMIIFDAGEAKTGHYSVGPLRADGKAPVCLHWDSPAMISPAEVRPQMGPPPAPPGAGGNRPAGVSICREQNFRTTCQFNVDPATLSEAERKQSNLSMGERFYQGMCYPMGPHYVGDIWFEADDPMPGQLGMDKMLLLPGRR